MPLHFGRQDSPGVGAPSAGALLVSLGTGVFALSRAGGGVLEDRSLKDMGYSFDCRQGSADPLYIVDRSAKYNDVVQIFLRFFAEII